MQSVPSELWRYSLLAQHDIETAKTKLHEGKRLTNSQFAALVWEKTDIPTCFYIAHFTKDDRFEGISFCTEYPLLMDESLIYHDPCHISDGNQKWAYELGTATMKTLIEALESKIRIPVCLVNLFGQYNHSGDDNKVHQEIKQMVDNATKDKK